MKTILYQSVLAFGLLTTISCTKNDDALTVQHAKEKEVEQITTPQTTPALTQDSKETQKEVLVGKWLLTKLTNKEGTLLNTYGNDGIFYLDFQNDGTVEGKTSSNFIMGTVTLLKDQNLLGNAIEIETSQTKAGEHNDLGWAFGDVFYKNTWMNYEINEGELSIVSDEATLYFKR